MPQRALARDILSILNGKKTRESATVSDLEK